MWGRGQAPLELVPEGEVQLEDVGVEFVQRLAAQRLTRRNIGELFIVNMQHVERSCDTRFLEKTPVIAIVAQEFVSRLQFDRIARQSTDLFVATTKIRGLRTRKQVAVKMRTCLVVISEFAGEGEVAPRMNIGQRPRVALNISGISEKSIFAFNRRPVRQEVTHPETDCISRAGVGV